jgi:hypothetical protein
MYEKNSDRKKLLTGVVGADNIFVDSPQHNDNDDEKNHIICFEVNVEKKPCLSKIPSK